MSHPSLTHSVRLGCGCGPVLPVADVIPCCSVLSSARHITVSPDQPSTYKEITNTACTVIHEAGAILYEVFCTEALQYLGGGGGEIIFKSIIAMGFIIFTIILVIF